MNDRLHLEKTPLSLHFAGLLYYVLNHWIADRWCETLHPRGLFLLHASYIMYTFGHGFENIGKQTLWPPVNNRSSFPVIRNVDNIAIFVQTSE